MQAIKQANNQENKQSNNQERSRTMNDNHNEDEAPFDGTSEDSTLEDQMSAHIAAIAASGVAAEAEVLANRYADMAARERRETRLAILAATVIVGTVIFVCRNKDGGIEVDTAKYYLNSSSCVN